MDGIRMHAAINPVHAVTDLILPRGFNFIYPEGMKGCS